jgi:hypothetical protein
VGWAYEYIHQCKQGNSEMDILKLDFAKAFNTVEHEAILKVFENFGYDSRWLVMLAIRLMFIVQLGTPRGRYDEYSSKVFPQ